MIGKLIIPKEVQDIIDILHKQIGAVEWSGILFYKLTSGNIRDFKDLEFTVKGIYPMNIGTSTYTEFEYNSDFIHAHKVFPDSLEFSTGLVHSHNSMSAFFSGTDTSELQDNAKNYNYYISLIVNFSKSYVAKIAFPSKTRTVLEYCIKDDHGKLVTAKEEVERTDIVIKDLDIVLEGSIPEIEWLNERISKLKKDSVEKNIVKTTFDSNTKFLRGLESLIPDKPVTHSLIKRAIPESNHTNKSLIFLDELCRVAVDLDFQQSCNLNVKVEPKDSDIAGLLYENFSVVHFNVFGNDDDTDKHSADCIVKLLEVADPKKNYILENVYEVLLEQLM